MEKAMTITYKVKNGIYINLTNKCNCACTFCLRKNASGVYGSDPLWLEREPEFDEICDSLNQWNFDEVDEIVFCGYGEPTERLDVLLKVAAFIKEKFHKTVRVNTNGLANLLYEKDVTPEFKNLVDVISISLNATNAEDYLKVTRAKYGIQSFDAMLDFANKVKNYVPKVVLTVVDVVTSKEEQEKAKKICDEIGVQLRVRAYEA